MTSDVNVCHCDPAKRKKTRRVRNTEICDRCNLPVPVPTDAPPTVAELAREARERGDLFFELQLEVTSSTREVAFGQRDFGQLTATDNTSVLASVEAQGWHLEHVGYVFVPTGQVSRDRLLGTGQNVAVNGVTTGIYLFRSVSLPPDPDAL